MDQIDSIDTLYSPDKLCNTGLPILLVNEGTRGTMLETNLQASLNFMRTETREVEGEGGEEGEECGTKHSNFI